MTFPLDYLSIIIATYRGDKLVRRCLDSLVVSSDGFPARVRAEYGIICGMGNKHSYKLNCWIYRDTVSYGHLGRASFPWEKLNRVAKLKAQAKNGSLALF